MAQGLRWNKTLVSSPHAAGPGRPGKTPNVGILDRNKRGHGGDVTRAKPRRVARPPPSPLLAPMNTRASRDGLRARAPTATGASGPGPRGGLDDHALGAITAAVTAGRDAGWGQPCGPAERALPITNQRLKDTI